ncbi:hypothetical protein NQ318_019474 [Aromia moschata]|uniref:Secreted protein n=1 Tax=Aromia moschata TaxID=1265417 RepID=A0AAV8YAG0_9CUCU|nr:hypothetical protein NQ318_019474 [Aromia moschata]
MFCKETSVVWVLVSRLSWCPTTDKLLYKINIASVNQIVTNRTILSNISQIFDPLGLLSPCVITVKILCSNYGSKKYHGTKDCLLTHTHILV